MRAENVHVMNYFIEEDAQQTIVMDENGDFVCFVADEVRVMEIQAGARAHEDNRIDPVVFISYIFAGFCVAGIIYGFIWIVIFYII